MDRSESHGVSVKPFVIGSIVVIAICCIAGLISWWCFGDWQTRGQFGDSFGAINSLFSGLAFAGVIFTILLQRHELALQREELKLTRMELQRSAEAQEKSQHTLSLQVKEQRFSAKLAAVSSLVSVYSRHLDHLKTYGAQDRLRLQKETAQSLSRYEQMLEQMLTESMVQHDQDREPEPGPGYHPPAAGSA